MPSFGFNPFAKRINVYTTGVEMGDAKRYYSRDVIRIGGERVAVDPVLTPGEPGRYHQTQFEESIQEEMKTPFDQREKLKFVEQKPLVDEKEDALDGLKSYDEFALLQKEKKRRKELYKYHLSTKEIEQILEFERIHSFDTNIDALPPNLRHLYSKIEVARRDLGLQESAEEGSGKKKSLAASLDSDMDMSLSLQRLRTPQARYYEDMTARDTQGVVVSHLPPSDSALLLKKLDEEFVKTYPILRDEVFHHTEKSSEKRCEDALKCSDKIPKEEKRIRVTKDAFLNPNVPLNYESPSDLPRDQMKNMKKDNELSQRDHSTDGTVHSEYSYATDEQMNQLSQMTKYEQGIPNSTIFIRNLPKNITCEELTSVCSSLNANNAKFTLLTGRMKGQAFVSFGKKNHSTLTLADVSSATEAIHYLHSLIYNGNPLIVSYKRNK